MRREPRMPDGPKVKDKWREELHPVFVEIMEQLKQNEPLSRSPWREDREKAQAWAKKAEIEFRTKGREVGDPIRNVAIIDAVIAGLCVLALTLLLSLYTLDVRSLYPSYLIWGRSLVRLALAALLYYLRPREVPSA